MSDRVDKLFEDNGTREPRSRAVWITLMLVVAVPLDLAGVLCCTSVPGAVLTLGAWLMADGDLARVESGHLPVGMAPRLHVLKMVATSALVFCMVSFVVQIILLSSGFYESLLMRLDSMF